VPPKPGMLGSCNPMCEDKVNDIQDRNARVQEDVTNEREAGILGPNTPSQPS
jgi:hypothetical protein